MAIMGPDDAVGPMRLAVPRQGSPVNSVSGEAGGGPGGSGRRSWQGEEDGATPTPRRPTPGPFAVPHAPVTVYGPDEAARPTDAPSGSLIQMPDGGMARHVQGLLRHPTARTMTATRLGLYSVFVIVDIILPQAVRVPAVRSLWAVHMACWCMELGRCALRLALSVWQPNKALSIYVWDMVFSIIAFGLAIGDYWQGVDTLLQPDQVDLRVLFRIVWLMTAAERAWRKAHIVRPVQLPQVARSAPMSSPLEKCITNLSSLVETVGLADQHREIVQQVLDILYGGDLFRPMRPVGQALSVQIDSETAAWMHQELGPQLSTPHPLDVVQEFDDGDVSVNDSRICGHSSRLDLHDSGAIKRIHSVKSMRVARRQRLSGYGASAQILELLRPTRHNGGQARGRVTADMAAAWLWGLALRTAQLRKALKRTNCWMMNVFRLSEITQGNPLYVLCQNLLHVHSVGDKLHLPTAPLQQLLLRIEAGYNKVPYHNSIHAADVVQTTHYFMVQPLLLPFMSAMHLLAGILAGAVHDYAHPGVNNAFEVATRSQLAIQYNDVAVLENMHTSSLFQLMREEDMNVLAAFSNEDYRKIRQLIVGLVLGTDMSKHFEDFAKFKARLAQIRPQQDMSLRSIPSLGHLQPQAPVALITVATDAQFFLQIAMHTADVSNPAKPLVHYRRWVTMVMEEFFGQGDQERDRGLPISTFFDRRQPNIPKFQLGFIDFIVLPLFQEWAKVVEDVNQTVLPLLGANRRYWERAAERAAQAPSVAVTVGPSAVEVPLPGVPQSSK